MPTLLMIDDEGPILHFFRRAFQGPEVEVLTATSAAVGLELFARHRPGAEGDGCCNDRASCFSPR